MATDGDAHRAGPEDGDLLRRSGLPIFFALGSADELGLSLPDNRHGQSVRVWARSLAGMQKEAVVASVRTGRVWRLASDEGPYLDGFDAAPCPLAFMTTGMVSSYMNALVAVAQHRGITLRRVELVQDNRYTMEGSALRGTMTGGALPVELEVRLDANAGKDARRELVETAVASAPIAGLLSGVHTSLFTLTANGDEMTLGRVGSLGRPAEPDPRDMFSRVMPPAPEAGETVSRLHAVESVAGVAGGAGSSLQAEQRRQLHVRALCRLRPDGVKEIEQHLYRPTGSTFRFLSDEASERGGRGSAPDAVSYMATGIAFCFMTQQGRYAAIVKKDLPAYRVVQDLHFSPQGTDGPGVTDAVETHVYLDTSEDEECARLSLDMAEQTCFLHALCRTPLETAVTITAL